MALRDFFTRGRGGSSGGRRWYEFWKPAAPPEPEEEFTHIEPEEPRAKKKWWQFWKKAEPEPATEPKPEPAPEPQPAQPPEEPPQKKRGRQPKPKEILIEPDIATDPDAELIERYRGMLDTMIERGWIDEFKTEKDAAEFLRVLSSSAWEEAHKYWYSEIAFLEIQEAIERGATARQLQDEYNKVVEKKTIGFLQAWEGWQEVMANNGIEINDAGTGFTVNDPGFTIDDVWDSMKTFN